MRISSFLSTARDLLIIAVIMVVILVGLFLIGYRLIYQKLMKGSKKLKIASVCLIAIFLCYLLVVFSATIFTRNAAEQGQQNILGLFDSYRFAWSTMSSYEWRYIILNICMFVPFGFLFPIVCKKFNRFWCTCLAGASFTIFIELLQLFSKRGIFEMDDIFNNLLGTLIGYGLYSIYARIVTLIQKNKGALQDKKHILLYQLPLLLTVAAFAGIFIYYNTKDLGNLACIYTTKFDMEDVEFVNQAHISDSFDDAMVYQVKTANIDEATAFVSDIFTKLGTSIDESRTDIYDESIIFHSKNHYSIWLNYKGYTWSLTNFGAISEEETDSETQITIEREQIESDLAKTGIDLPEQCTFEELGGGQYQFTINEDLVDDILYNGTLSCTYNAAGVLTSIDNQILTCTTYKEYTLISQQQAFELLKSGHIYTWYYDLHDIDSIIINDVKLEYLMDSKGFYQPVYMFYTTINNTDTVTLPVSAIRN